MWKRLRRRTSFYCSIPGVGESKPGLTAGLVRDGDALCRKRPQTISIMCCVIVPFAPTARRACLRFGIWLWTDACLWHRILVWRFCLHLLRRPSERPGALTLGVLAAQETMVQANQPLQPCRATTNKEEYSCTQPCRPITRKGPSESSGDIRQRTWPDFSAASSSQNPRARKGFQEGSVGRGTAPGTGEQGFGHPGSCTWPSCRPAQALKNGIACQEKGSGTTNVRVAESCSFSRGDVHSPAVGRTWRKVTPCLGGAPVRLAFCPWGWTMIACASYPGFLPTLNLILWFLMAHRFEAANVSALEPSNKRSKPRMARRRDWMMARHHSSLVWESSPCN